MILAANAYRILVEQAPILIWRSGLDMGCDYFNERWLEFTGRTMAQELGNGWAEGVHQDDFDRCLEIYTTSFKAQRVFEMEYRLRRHDGDYRWLFDRGVPFQDDQGQFAGFIGSCVDVHDRVEAQRELDHVRKEQLLKIQKLLPLCSWCGQIKDGHGEWHSIEDYIDALHLGQVSHAMCPSCFERERPSNRQAQPGGI